MPNLQKLRGRRINSWSIFGHPSLNPIFTAIIKIVSTKIFVEIKLTPKVYIQKLQKLLLYI